VASSLDNLEQSSREWIDKEKDRVNNEVKFLKAVLEGTSGSSTLRRLNAETAEIFLADTIKTFLEE
jgi:hypothetical protein